MATSSTTNKKLTSQSGEDEMPIELRIVCSVKPGDASNSPTCRITNVAVSQTHDEDLDHDFDAKDEDFDESDSKIAEIHKLRRKESKGDSNRSVKKKHVDVESDDDEEDGEDDWDTEDLDGDDEDDQDTVLSCVQRSMVKQGSASLKKKR